MKRRNFIGTAAATGLAGALPLSAQPNVSVTKYGASAFDRIPDTIAGMSLEKLRDDYHDRLFNQYLPFWDKGGVDKEFGGFMCELNGDGTIFADEKFLMYQGRGIWVYSFLYNNFGKDKRFLDIAKKARDFAVNRMCVGDGKWYNKVHRDGKIIEGVTDYIWGWQLMGTGLGEYYKAVGNEEDLKLSKLSFKATVEAYNDPESVIVKANGINKRGLRDVGFSFEVVWFLSEFLTYHTDPRLEEFQQEQTGLINDKFWNPDYGILNMFLQHDYSRVPGYESHMFAGHAVESYWMVMQEALRRKDRALFDLAKERLRRVIEMCWDYVYGGYGDEDFYVFESAEHPRGPKYDVKTMWACCEFMISCMSVFEYTGEVWAKEWYERMRAFTLRTMTTDYGVWRQAVNRTGENIKRQEVSAKRKCNFHQPRYLMKNLLSLDRMIKNKGKLTPFPG